MLTFNRTLSGYVEHLATEQVKSSEDISLEVETFSRWAIGLCYGHRDVVDDHGRLRQGLRAAGFTRDQGYFLDEVQYVLGPWRPSDREAYLEAERFGRGRAPAVPGPLRARLLTEVIAAYERQNASLGMVDWNDIALEAAAAPSQQYDIVVVDEAQDLSANQIRAVVAHLAEDHTTTFVMDAIQRIYPQAFRWREVGVSIRPNDVFTLRTNHRNTVAIARLAASLVRDLPADEDGVVPDPAATAREGPRPQILAGTYSSQLDHLLHAITPALESGETVAVSATPRRGVVQVTRGRRSRLVGSLLRTDAQP